MSATQLRTTSTTTPPEVDGAVNALAALTGPTPEHLAELHDRLAQEAAALRLLDLAYTTIDSPVGSLLLASTERGLVRVAFDVEDHDRVLETLADRVGSRVLRAPARLADATRELDEYFSGLRKGFDLTLDFCLSHGFRQVVQQFLPSIAYGQTLSYKEVAASVGHPSAVRAVGTACATNPLPIVLPCHRVLRADGGLGGYLGGTQAKSALLSLEHAA